LFIDYLPPNAFTMPLVTATAIFSQYSFSSQSACPRVSASCG
jgi:hypothetical protein